MALNLFKKTKPEEDKRVEKVEVPDKEKTSEASSSLGMMDTSLVLRGVHVTEKAGHLNSLNQYVFKVSSRSNKIEIKKAVEKAYGVKVDRVMIAVMPAKKRRLGQQEGERAGFKKAVIKLVEGHKIDIASK